MFKRYFCLLMLVGILITITSPNTVSLAQDGAQAVVAYNHLNVRVGPHEQAEIVGQLMMDMVVTIHAQEDFTRNGGLWVYVSSGDLTGWVRSEYLAWDARVVWNNIPVGYGEGAGVATAEVIALARQPLELRSEPQHHAASTSSIAIGELVAVQGQEDLCCNSGIWLYVIGMRSGASGWVQDQTLMYPASMRRRGNSAFNMPILVHNPDGMLAEPYMPQGIGIYTLYGRARIRTLPDENAPIVLSMRRGDRRYFIAYGRSEDGEWTYVRQLNGDIAGWVYHWYAGRNAPVFESVENPPLPPPPTPILEMPSTVRAYRAGFRLQPSIFYPVAEWIPRGTELVIRGRNVLSQYFMVEYDGQVGWVSRSELNYEGDVTLLPIWSLRW